MRNLVLGTVQFGLDYGINNHTGRLNHEQISNILQVAFNSNITELDTAQDYGNSEEVLAECLKYMPENFIIHSKFIDSKISVQEAIEKSLKRLNIKKLGYFFFHNYSDYLNYRSLKPKGEKLTGCLGLAVSVYDESELALTLNDDFVKAVQLPFNVFDCSEEKIVLMKAAKEAGKKIYIRSVFLQGLFFMSPETLPKKLRSLKKPLQKLIEIADKNKLSIRDLALGYVNHFNEIDGIVIGVDNLSHLNENISSAKINLDIRLIDEISSIVIEDKTMILPKNW